MVTLKDIQSAHNRIAPFIHRTPILTNKSLNELTGAELYFKCENFQKDHLRLEVQQTLLNFYLKRN